MPIKPKKPKMGEIAPDFDLKEATTEKNYKLKDFEGKKLVMVFLRGTW